MIVCGAPPDSDGLSEVLKTGALAMMGDKAGWMFRAHPNHWPLLSMNEADAYVPACTCGWLGAGTPDIGAALATHPRHLRDINEPGDGRWS